ncbi:MAG: hypothetical protein ACE5ES_00830 [Candidatus Nanoarchaeia archaeon]
MKVKEVEENFDKVFLILLISVLATSTFILAQDVFQAPSQPTNVTVTVSGAIAPQIVFVSSILNPFPIELGSTTITFNIHMSDGDGVNNLDDASVNATFTKPGEAVRQDFNCPLQNDIDGLTANYSCSIDMQYFDENGNWGVTVRGMDTEGNVATNDTATFSYQLLKAIVVSPGLITFPTVNPGSTNQQSNNDPTTVNNTGNDNRSFNLNAIDLSGETDSSFSIPAANFSVHATSGSECTGTVLVNGTSTTITSSLLDNGNLSLGGGVAQETIFYCIRQVPANLPSQQYSTLGGGSWVISI